MVKKGLENRSVGTWGQVAAELLAFERDHDKKRKFASMANFIRAQSESKNRAETTLWRLLSAGRFYEEIQQKLLSENEDTPALEDAKCKASVESLELLQKISRVVPQSVLRPLETRTLLGEASRRELRAIWETYRPVLGGKTKRGRGKAAPTYDSRSESMRLAMIEANAMDCIMKLGTLGLILQDDSDMVRLIPISGKPNQARSLPFRIDLALVTMTRHDGSLFLHGFEVLAHPYADPSLFLFVVNTAPVDFFWIAFPEPPHPEHITQLDDRIGILCTDQNAASVLRPAKLLLRTEENAEHREQLLRFLLFEFSRSR